MAQQCNQLNCNFVLYSTRTEYIQSFYTQASPKLFMIDAYQTENQIMPSSIRVLDMIVRKQTRNNATVYSMPDLSAGNTIFNNQLLSISRLTPPSCMLKDLLSEITGKSAYQEVALDYHFTFLRVENFYENQLFPFSILQRFNNPYFSLSLELS